MKNIVRVKVTQENGLGTQPAQVLVYLGERLVIKVVAEVVSKQGADGGMYPCVSLKDVGVNS